MGDVTLPSLAGDGGSHRRYEDPSRGGVPDTAFTPLLPQGMRVPIVEVSLPDHIDSEIDRPVDRGASSTGNRHRETPHDGDVGL